MCLLFSVGVPGWDPASFTAGVRSHIHSAQSGSHHPETGDIIEYYVDIVYLNFQYDSRIFLNM